MAPERGAGLVATIAGVNVFLVFLLLAVQVTVNLFAQSAVTAATYDAARIVAGADVADGLSPADLTDAERHARAVLGEIGTTARFRWDVTADEVALAVSVAAPRVLPPTFGRFTGLDRVERTVHVRREVLR